MVPKLQIDYCQTGVSQFYIPTVAISVFQMWWHLYWPLYCKFAAECSGEEILTIGQCLKSAMVFFDSIRTPLL